MVILNSKKELQDFISEVKKNNKTIGFAPTMGALHDGHLSLYQQARPENNVVISSIFVNPTQFNNPSDLEKYPRTIEDDILKLKNSNLVDAVYIPSIKDIYPENTASKHYDFGGLENEMEGKMRPGHFDGVGTVVEELFKQIQPDNAYFGEKDFQQLAIIKKLVELCHLNIKLHGVPIYREENGLAMSSRNMRLSDEQRQKATILHKVLTETKQLFKEKTIEEILQYVQQFFKNEKDIVLEYFTIANEENLKETKEKNSNSKYRAFIVVHFGEVRLIDNLSLN